MEPFVITCPRCRAQAQERFYGPCTSCRGELAAALGSEGHEMADVDYEPKANVVPNQVATKE